MQTAGVRLPMRVLADAEGWRLEEWLVKPRTPVYRNQRVAVLKSLTSGAVDHALAPRKGTFLSADVPEGSVVEKPDTMIAQIEFCPHSVVFRGVCAICGEEAEPAHFAESSSREESRLPVAYNATSLSITRAEAASVSSSTAKRLFEAKRLSLVLDLDHTLVHATDDLRANAVFHHSPPGSDLSSVSMFNLAPHSESSGATARMYLKLRPNLHQFLTRVATRFELHIYTMGSRVYADRVAHLIDPDKRFFSGRITSREDFSEGRCNQKSIQRLFPCDDSMVLIVDDREDVWISGTGQTHMPNLLRADPYCFWDGLNECYDRNAQGKTQNPSSPSEANVRQPPTPVVLHVNGNGKPLKQSKTLSQPKLETLSAGEGKSAAVMTTKSEPEQTRDCGHDPSETRVDRRSSGTRTNLQNPSLAEHQKKAEPHPRDEPSPGTSVRKTIPSGRERSKTATSTEASVNVQQKTELAHKAEPGPSKPAEVKKYDKSGVVMKRVVRPGERSGASDSTCTSSGKDRPGPEVDDAALKRLRESVKHRWEVDELPRSKNHLLRLAQVLEECHAEFFRQSKRASKNEGWLKRSSSFQARPDVKDILSDMRRKVLSGCVVTFTGVIPTGANPSSIPAWNLALRLGAVCSMDFVNGRTTHVVASEHRSTNTQKCKEAMHYGTAFVVSTRWLEDSALNFERQQELPYCDRANQGFASAVDFRASVEKRYAEAARLFNKRRKEELDGVSSREVFLPRKRQRIVRETPEVATLNESITRKGSGLKPRVLSEEEIEAAMEAAFEE